MAKLDEFNAFILNNPELTQEQLWQLDIISQEAHNADRVGAIEPYWLVYPYRIAVSLASGSSYKVRLALVNAPNIKICKGSGQDAVWFWPVEEAIKVDAVLVMYDYSQKPGGVEVGSGGETNKNLYRRLAYTNSLRPVIPNKTWREIRGTLLTEENLNRLALGHSLLKS
jgi:hypothetical protein